MGAYQFSGKTGKNLPFTPFDKLRTGFDTLKANRAGGGRQCRFAVHAEPVEA
jgi:hypothetical protein